MEIDKCLLFKKLKEGSQLWNSWLTERKKIEQEELKIEVRNNKVIKNMQVVEYDLHIKFPTLKIEQEILENFKFSNLKWTIECKNITFKNCKFNDSKFDKSIFYNCVFNNCQFKHTSLIDCNFNYSKFKQCSFYQEANLSKSDFYETNFIKTNFSNSTLIGTRLIYTKFKYSSIVNCEIFGSAIWNIQIDNDTTTKDLIISQKKETAIRVDNLEIAQFVYLLLNNQKIRDVITTLTDFVATVKKIGKNGLLMYFCICKLKNEDT